MKTITILRFIVVSKLVLLSIIQEKAQRLTTGLCFAGFSSAVMKLNTIVTTVESEASPVWSRHLSLMSPQWHTVLFVISVKTIDDTNDASLLGFTIIQLHFGLSLYIQRVCTALFPNQHKTCYGAYICWNQALFSAVFLINSIFELYKWIW